jgi:hypothetical protein
VNRKQRIVILIGTILIALMLLFPPWVSRMVRPGVDTNAGYGFLLDPSFRIKIDVGNLALNRDFNSFVQIDTPRLFIQCLVVVILCAGTVFLFHRK